MSGVVRPLCGGITGAGCVMRGPATAGLLEVRSGDVETRRLERQMGRFAGPVVPRWMIAIDGGGKGGLGCAIFLVLLSFCHDGDGVGGGVYWVADKILGDGWWFGMVLGFVESGRGWPRRGW
ncbi:putative proline-rich receptor-like protein kinase PERK13 [Iris pallida]|uniref:Proline-rich receptor-like protein kinase PERK13 n=1 Tax=Iris pallida TaxID=29817 RepID=A0AAX6E1H9_IRIPA|nr:putative proline-rich receptor-like protein kinase PERK13 [Iris pallida]